MNPELQRRIWTDITPRRLGFLGIVLAVILAVAWSLPHPDSKLATVAGTAAAIFFVLTVLWGGRNAGEAISADIRDRTWDLQRMSALSASSMAYGKFVGATLFVWIGAAVCLAVMAIAPATDLLDIAIAPDGPWPQLFALWRMVGAALLAQVAAFVAAILAMRRGVSGVRWSLVVSVGAALAVWSLLQTATSGFAVFSFNEQGVLEGWNTTTWWGLETPVALFVSLAIALYILIGAVAAVRLIRRDMLERGDGLFLSIVAVITGVLIGGFAHDGAADSNGIASGIGVAAGAIIAIAWGAAVIEPKDPRRTTRTAALVRTGQFAEAATLAPAFVAPLLTGALALAAFLIVGAIQGVEAGLLAFPVCILFFAIRDIALILGFCTGDRPEKGEFPALVVLAVNYLALGPLVHELAPPAAALFWPMVDGFPGVAGPIYGLMAAATPAIIAVVWAALRLKRNAQWPVIAQT
jgi:hypothetical protein